MAVTEWWLGRNSQTSATVVCVSDVSGPVTVTCNGQAFVGNADTAVLSGGVVIEVTGLSAGSRYDYSVDGVTGGSLKTKPASGDVWIVSGSCWAQYESSLLAALHESEIDPDVVIFLGDFPYADTSENTFEGITTVGSLKSVANSKDYTNYVKQHRKIRRFPGIKDVLRNYPTWYIPDDHEYVFDNAAPILALYQAGVVGATTATQTDFDEAWAACLAGNRFACMGNPVNTDSGIDADAEYFRDSFHNIEIFVTDACRYRSSPAAVDDASKRMLGPAQEPWLCDSINNSTATFKLWASPKQFWAGGANTDAYSYVSAGSPGYQTELARCLYAIKGQTGVLAVAGDQHLPSDQMVAADELGAGYPAISCLVGCPTGVLQNPTALAAFQFGVKWRGYTLDGGNRSSMSYNVAAVFRVTDSRIYRYLFTLNGLIPRGYIDAGSNQVQYPQVRFG